MNPDVTEQIVIRAAHDGDRDFVVGLVPSLLEFGSPAWKDVEGLAEGFSRVLADALSMRAHSSAVLIAQGVDGAPLGFISLTVRKDVAGIERGHVADLAVTERARRAGVGRALMRAGEAWARERGLPAVTLDVWSTNTRALAFYRRLGYSPESLSLIKTLD